MLLLTLVSAAVLSAGPSTASNIGGCLPADIQSSDVVSVEAVPSGPHRAEVKRITVAKKLKELRARCRKGKLVDARGREIRIHRLLGCWGNPPDDYQEQLARQSRELASLRKRYRVIEVRCIPSGPQISQVRPELNEQRPDRQIGLLLKLWSSASGLWTWNFLQV